MFKNATFKLTLSYLSVLMVISLIFSTVVYRIGSNNLAFGLTRESRELSSSFPIFNGTRFGQLDPTDLAVGRTHLLDQLILTNLFVLVSAGLISYALARETLKPIEEAHEHQKRFVADASHELRTPLTALRMESEVALMDHRLDSKALRKVISSNIEEAAKLEVLINNLMKLSLLEAGKQQKQFVPLDLKPLAKEAIDNIKLQAEAKNISVVVKASKQGKFRTKGDRDSLIQLLVIFLDNAIKYSPHNTRVVLNLERTNNDIVSIRIIDQGPGIKAEHLEHVFDRFYRANASRSGESGFGLGLSIAKLITDVHQAVITITSAPKQGTTVQVDFPTDNNN
jgi:signal transduction histidine kinase